MAPFIVTGAPVSPSLQKFSPPNRLEIYDFVKDEMMFSLYIQALTVMCNTDQDDILSFFQIAGIHGMPYVPWNNVGTPSSAGTWGGYCTHGTTLFPTWHRPYIALFEQTIQKHAADIADTYSVDRTSWKAVAAQLRQPFWDWARNTVPPPEVISLSTVTIIIPDGTRAEVENPFLQYRFNPIEPTFKAPFVKWPTTIRCPSTQDTDATCDVEKMISQLEAEQRDVRAKTYTTLMRVHTWPAFSCHTAHEERSVGNSIESIHDKIHDIVGGGGHMGDPTVAAFDPIFFLHHAQIDRLLALWSALHPGVWVSQDNEADGTFTMPDKSLIDVNTPLTPFWDSENSFWTSFNSAGFVRFGYSYPDFDGLDLNNQATVKSHIREIVSHLYGPLRKVSNEASTAATLMTRKSSETSLRSVASGAESTLSISDSIVFISNSASLMSPAGQDPSLALACVGGDEPARIDANATWEWSVRIRVKQYEVGCSFSILVFLGEIPDNPVDWRTSASYVGSHHAFVNGAPGRCANCRKQSDLVVEGFVHLNDTIVETSGLSGAEPDLVRPYLQQHLGWRVQKTGGTPIPVEEVTSLEVTVLALRVRYLPEATFSLSEEPVFYHDICSVPSVTNSLQHKPSTSWWSPSVLWRRRS